MSFLFEGSPLIFIPALAAKIGLNEAIVLQQIHYWINPKRNKNIKDGRHWVYNSYPEWQKQFPFWSEITIKRLFISLEKRGFLISSSKNTNPLHKTKWYTLDYDKISLETQQNQRMYQIDTIDRIKLIPSSYQIDTIVDNIDTKTTTETTSSMTFRKTRRRRKGGEEKDDFEMLEERKVDQMLLFWSRIVCEGAKRISGYESLRWSLLDALERFFGGNVNNWKLFCQRIASSNFLMGETKSRFSITLEWALTEDAITKINGERYAVGNRETWPFEITEVEDAELKKTIQSAKKLLKDKPSYMEKGLNHCFFMHIKNLGEGHEMQLLLKKTKNLEHPKLKELFEKWKTSLEEGG